jgi:PHD finger-like domain-containing protein 5A
MRDACVTGTLPVDLLRDEIRTRTRTLDGSDVVHAGLALFWPPKKLSLIARAAQPCTCGGRGWVSNQLLARSVIFASTIYSPTASNQHSKAPTPAHQSQHQPSTMSKHHPDLIQCKKAPGISIGRLCDKCDGKCPVCDSYVRPTTLVRVCDECSFGNYQNKCIVCGGEGISDAFYCFECTRLEKDRDGCPKIINLGSSRTDLFYQKKNFRNQNY